MRNRLIALCIAVCLLILPSISFSAAHSLLQSVRPLAIVGEGALRNICTASSINEEKRLWLTAAHCVDGTEPVYLLGEGVTMVIQDVKADIAIVSTVTAALPALKLATKGPRVEDRIKVAGYPFGFTQPLITLGTVATPSIVLDPNYPAFMLIQAAGAPGNSGSPIVNTKHEIVSVLQIGWGRTFSPIMGGATFDVLAGYRLYWQ